MINALKDIFDELEKINARLDAIERKPTQYFIEYKDGVAPLDVIEKIRRSIQRGPTL